LIAAASLELVVQVAVKGSSLRQAAPQPRTD